MKIRGKLLTLILIPLLAVTTAAVWGFREQSVTIEQAEDALDLAGESASVHRVVIAYGNERLALYSDLTTAEIAELRLVTDEAVADAGLSSDVVETARAQSDRITGADHYTDAIGELLATIGSGSDVYTAEQLLTSIGANASYLLLEARETAWFDYIETTQIVDAGAANLSLVPVAVSLSEATTLAEQAGRLIDEQGERQLETASDSRAEQNMVSLAFLATNEMAAGATRISPSQIIDGLTDGRVEWNRALVSADEFLVDSSQQIVDDANGIRYLFSLLGVVGLVVLAGLVLVIHRSIAIPLENLSTSARSVAQVELPALVDRLRNEENFDDLPAPIGIPVTNNDEIGRLVEAFNDVQLTAHELATEQALGRRNVAEMFVNLGRRNQQLLQRILGLLTDLERDEEDPDTLRDLFVLDNVVTRMRRNAESLLVLAGGQTPRQWSDPVSLEDTVRSALSEIEHYERIDIAALAEVHLAGNVVADVAHLLAELIENAVSFSDPSTQVLVGGHFERDGYVVTIFDQGIGMTDDELDDSNRRIVDPPPLDQAPSKFLGLFVVGRLADRHDIRVRLGKAPGRGVLARVLIPNATLISDEEVDRFVVDTTVMETAEVGFDDADLGDLDDVMAEVGTDELPVRTPVSKETVLRPETELVAESELPTRVRGDALGEASADTEPAVQAEQREAIGEEAANSFSSMMSAFSTGVDRGLEDASFDALDEGSDQ